MDFYEVIEKRHMIRDLFDKPVKHEVIERILEAGMKAPSNDHMRSWEFIIINDKEKIAEIVKKIPKKVSEKRLDFIMKSWRLNDECQQKMYRDAIPKQYSMLTESACLILPLFKQSKPLLEPKSISSLNAFASIWCCIENMLLAVAAEGLGCALRIPLGNESEYITDLLDIPKNYIMPCYIAVGFPAENATVNEQLKYDIKEKMHYDKW